jgi:hypothetical protein
MNALLACLAGKRKKKLCTAHPFEKPQNTPHQSLRLAFANRRADLGGSDS